jgi:hypothetical protein
LDTLNFSSDCLQALSIDEKSFAAAVHVNSVSVSLPLRALGRLSDARWKDLVNIIALEDSNNGSSNSSSKDAQASKLRRRRPLLLLFPFHNDSNILSCYRSKEFMERFIDFVRNRCNMMSFAGGLQILAALAILRIR